MQHSYRSNTRKALDWDGLVSAASSGCGPHDPTHPASLKWDSPAWCFEFSSRRCSGLSKNLRRGAHASLRSLMTKERSSCRTIGTAIHHNIPRRREVLIHRISTPPKPPSFRRWTESFDSGGGIYQGQRADDRAVRHTKENVYGTAAGAPRLPTPTVSR